MSLHGIHPRGESCWSGIMIFLSGVKQTKYRIYVRNREAFSCFFLFCLLGHDRQNPSSMPFFFWFLGYDRQNPSYIPFFFCLLGHGKQDSSYMPFFFLFPWAWHDNFFLYTLLFPFRLGMTGRILPICPSFSFSLGMTSRILLVYPSSVSLGIFFNRNRSHFIICENCFIRNSLLYCRRPATWSQ